MNENQIKGVIVAEYLSGKYSYRELAAKHGYSVGWIHKWVKRYRGKMSKPLLKKSPHPLPAIAKEAPVDETLPWDVNILRAELHKARLHNKVLEAVIDIAEEELGVPIRKKHGTRQS